MFLTDICNALNQAKVKYAVVGGYAVALHGAVRGTVDLDLVISLNKPSFITAEKTFKKLGLESRLPITAEEVFKFRVEYIKNRNLIAWSFYDPVHPSNQLDVIITTDLKNLDTTSQVINGTKVHLVSVNSLIEMKQRAGRPQDLIDVQMLKELRKK